MLHGLLALSTSSITMKVVKSKCQFLNFIKILLCLNRDNSFTCNIMASKKTVNCEYRMHTVNEFPDNHAHTQWLFGLCN